MRTQMVTTMYNNVCCQTESSQNYCCRPIGIHFIDNHLIISVRIKLMYFNSIKGAMSWLCILKNLV